MTDHLDPKVDLEFAWEEFQRIRDEEWNREIEEYHMEWHDEYGSRWEKWYAFSGEWKKQVN